MFAQLQLDVFMGYGWQGSAHIWAYVKLVYCYYPLFHNKWW